jgi:hypothetical protein
MIDSCERCGIVKNLEEHHIVYRSHGGSDAAENKVTLCFSCHDYRHAKEAVEKAITWERKRLAVLERRLEIIEKENTPELIQARGYQPYFQLFKELVPPMRGCKQMNYEAKK